MTPPNSEPGTRAPEISSMAQSFQKTWRAVWESEPIYPTPMPSHTQLTGKATVAQRQGKASQEQNAYQPSTTTQDNRQMQKYHPKLGATPDFSESLVSYGHKVRPCLKRHASC